MSYIADLLYDGCYCQSTINCKGSYIIIKDLSTKVQLKLQCILCGKNKKFFFNSIFARSHIEVHKILLIIYYGARYKGIASIAESYKNLIVNHSQNFSDSQTN